MNAQTSFNDEIIVDCFAGGGGASTGIEIATGRVVDIAINHDPAAILLHKTNHHYTEHYEESVWAVDPVKVCRGRPVGLLWASPDCKHFSRAKGSALCDKKIRGLAWVVLRWAGTVRPRVILLENVPEFQTWCPTRKGRPIKSKTGSTFRKWLSQLHSLGYVVEWRKLTACDYGAPTSRTRLVLCARCDGRPIAWPNPTHGAPDSAGVKSGALKPWHTAAEIIDWSLPSYSIFASKAEIKEAHGVNVVRPLADNTIKRIARGLDKFVIKAKKPFIVPRGYGERDGQAPRVHGVDAPAPTVVGTDKHYVCRPELSPFGVTVNHSGDKFRGQDLNTPLSTVTAKHGYGVVTPELSPYLMCNNDHNIGAGVDTPTPTITTANRNFIASAALVQYHDREDAQYSLDRPLLTVDGSNRYGLMAPILNEWYGNAAEGLELDKPLRTITTKDREALVPLYLAYFKGQDRGQRADEPLRTITAGDGQFGRVEVLLHKTDGRDLSYWPQVRDMLNKYCDYDIKGDEVMLFHICGNYWFVSDICLRMLAPKELYAAMGFPPDYKFERDYLGNAYPRTQQVAKCGNAVCPPLATAMVRANLPEWCCKVDISTMAELLDMVAI